MTEIKPFEVLEAMSALARIGHCETAHRAMQWSSAVSLCRCRRPARRGSMKDLKGALAAPALCNHAAILDPAKLGELLHAIDRYTGTASKLFAFKLLPHVFTRPGELRQVTWTEIDCGAAVWTTPAGRMKMHRPQHYILCGWLPRSKWRFDDLAH